MNTYTSNAEIVGPWVAAKTGGEHYSGSCAALGKLRDGRLVGGVIYERYNGVNVECHIAGEGRGWLDREFLWMMFDYPFNQLGVHRITGVVASTNEAAVKLDEHLGFEREAVLKGAAPGGDLIIYCMTRDQCKWLGVKNGKEQRAEDA